MKSKGSRVLFKRATGDVTAEIKTGRNGQLVAKTDNYLLVPLAIMEAIITAILMALNYCFRFDPNIRLTASMVNLSSVLISCDQDRLSYELGRPYFDYAWNSTKSMEGLALNYDLPEWVFFLCILLISTCIICFVEGMRAWFPGRKYKDVKTFGYSIPQVARRIPRIMFGYITGGCITGIFICILKYNIVSPRPYLMSVCFRNDYNGTSPKACTRGELYWNPVSDCKSPVNKEGLAEALMSFPSYHAAISVFCGVYLSAYLTWAAKIRSLYSGNILVILCLMVLTLIGGTHRLATGHSFPSDIYIGAILGFFASLYVVKSTMHRFQERDWKIKSGKDNEMLPIKLLNRRKRSSSDEESSTDVDSDTDHKDKLATSVADASVYPLIPRAVPANTLPTQAINSNVGVTNNMSGISPYPTNAGLTIESAWKRNSGNKDFLPWTTGSSSEPYNMPKQRSLGPVSKQEPHHRSNSSFWGAERKQSPQNAPPLSAYGTSFAFSNPAMEAASKF